MRDVHADSMTAFYTLPGVIDAFWPLWDGRRQSRHDKTVRSVVVQP